MPLHPGKTLALIFCSLTISACDQSPPDQPAPPASVNVTMDSNPYPNLDNSLTIRDVMNSLIDPSADELWDSVAYILHEDGTEEERQPETEEDWEALRLEAIRIIEGANSLIIPGREVAPPGSTTDFPEFEFEPHEVAVLLEQDRSAWVGFAQGLQTAARSVINAIDARDVDGLVEYGSEMDQACESCHEHYWYRP